MTPRTPLMYIAALVMSGMILQSQTPDPLTSEARASYARVKGFILKAADAMPEQNYGFKPTADVRTFGELLIHVAETQMRTCAPSRAAPSRAAPSRAANDAVPKTGKAQTISAISASFEACDKAFEEINDNNIAQVTGTGWARGTRLASLYGTVVHDNEMYGVMGIYMRLKGLVPPSSEGSGR